MKKNVGKLIRFTGLALALVIALFPIYWMLNTSFKTQKEVYSKSPTYYPHEVSFSGYQALAEDKDFFGSVGNSFLVAIVVSTFTIAVALPCAFAIAKLKFRGRRLLSKSVLFTYLVPATVLYIPLYIFLSMLKIGNSLLGLMVIYPTATIPYAVWILIPYLGSIPVELEEAALVDGCTRFQTMWRIVFPLAIPGILTTFIFSFTMCWGEYLYALVSITDSSIKTFPLVISGFIWGDLYPWSKLMAAGIVVCVPVLLIYTLSSKLVVGGMTAGGVKQ